MIYLKGLWRYRTNISIQQFPYLRFHVPIILYVCRMSVAHSCHILPKICGPATENRWILTRGCLKTKTWKWPLLRSSQVCMRMNVCMYQYPSIINPILTLTYNYLYIIGHNVCMCVCRESVDHLWQEKRKRYSVQQQSPPACEHRGVEVLVRMYRMYLCMDVCMHCVYGCMYVLVYVLTEKTMLCIRH